MSIEILMQYDEPYAEMGDIASARAKVYCEKHGYTLRVSRTLHPGSPFWSKIHFIRDHLWSDGEYLVWMDADSLILDLGFKLETLIGTEDVQLLLPTDSSGICTGFMGVRHCNWARDLFNAWLFLGQKAGEVIPGVSSNANEQATLMLFDKFFPEVHDRIKRVPDTIISNPESPNKGTFMHMYWSRCFDKRENASAMRCLLRSRT